VRHAAALPDSQPRNGAALRLALLAQATCDAHSGEVDVSEAGWLRSARRSGCPTGLRAPGPSLRAPAESSRASCLPHHELGDGRDYTAWIGFSADRSWKFPAPLMHAIQRLPASGARIQPVSPTSTRSGGAPRYSTAATPRSCASRRRATRTSALRHSLRKRPLKDSTLALSVGLPGREKSSSMPFS